MQHTDSRARHPRRRSAPCSPSAQSPTDLSPASTRAPTPSPKPGARRPSRPSRSRQRRQGDSLRASRRRRARSPRRRSRRGRSARAKRTARRRPSGSRKPRLSLVVQAAVTSSRNSCTTRRSTRSLSSGSIERTIPLWRPIATRSPISSAHSGLKCPVATILLATPQLVAVLRHRPPLLLQGKHGDNRVAAAVSRPPSRPTFSATSGSEQQRERGELSASSSDTGLGIDRRRYRRDGR